MTAKEYLDQIRLLNVKIDQKIQEKEELMSLAESRGSQAGDPNKVQTSGSTAGPMRYVDKAVDMESRIDRMIDSYIDLKDTIINQINQLDDPRYIELLSLKYVGRRDEYGRIHYFRLEEIACTMTKRNGEPYSYDHINRLHGEALQKFYKQHGIAKL